MEENINTTQQEEGELQITEQDVLGMMQLFTQVPNIMLKKMVNAKQNIAKSFAPQIIMMKTQIPQEELPKIKLVTEMDIQELQAIVERAYQESNVAQLQTLAYPSAEPFIKTNLETIKILLFGTQEQVAGIIGE